VLPLGIDRTGNWYLSAGKPESLSDGTWLGSPALSRIWFGFDGSFFSESGRTYTPDVVFPALHGQFCEDGRLQGFLDYWGVPYVGCGVESSVLAMNKVLSKRLAHEAGIPTLPWVQTHRDGAKEAILRKLSFPLFIKPVHSGSSIGAARADTERELEAALEIAFSVDDTILAEPFFAGRELEVAVLDDGTPTVSRVGEIAYHTTFYDYETKYHGSAAETYLPARISDGLATRARQSAAILFRTLGCRHLARVDFFTDGEQLYFNEINTLPGFTSGSLYPALMQDSGISLPALLTRLCNAALRDDRGL
jgi:D-alanine-D-alanine ligase